MEMETERNLKAIAFILSTRYTIVFSSFVMLYIGTGTMMWLVDEWMSDLKMTAKKGGTDSTYVNNRGGK
jgi:hypothetical protein